ncbi:hypothetical protein [Actinocrinis sp.]|uniref:hypothetical protein n=1 Tax=Actinocrinis sp. TaxID=1920516 RepID=UPI002D62311D|nr:hypothetical protein [Actinocrinis sp.]HZP53872.1 hypothetical protein [Actinocrinis sp.]
MPAHWDVQPRYRESVEIHASPDALAAMLKDARAEHRRVGRVVEYLERLHEKRAAERAAGTWPYAKDPRAVEAPCGKSHVCVVCSPAPDVPGKGCSNCRATGFDQTPCVPCAEATEAGAR